MDIESKIWTYAGTGTKVHAFVDGVALCRKNLRNDPDRVGRVGHDWAGAVHYASVCSSCQKKFNAAIERAEASMQPSTGEGDYLPPAEAATETPAAENTRCQHAAMYHGANGCDECACTQPRSDYSVADHADQDITNREDTMNERRRTDGPLSGVQVKILDRLLLGERQKEMAADMGSSEQYVSAELSLAASKLQARTAAQAAALWATANAYREAADLIDSQRPLQPDNKVDQHVDHVLAGLADLLRTRADRLSPK